MTVDHRHLLIFFSLLTVNVHGETLNSKTRFEDDVKKLEELIGKGITTYFKLLAEDNNEQLESLLLLHGSKENHAEPFLPYYFPNESNIGISTNNNDNNSPNGLRVQGLILSANDDAIEKSLCNLRVSNKSPNIPKINENLTSANSMSGNEGKSTATQWSNIDHQGKGRYLSEKYYQPDQQEYYPKDQYASKLQPSINENIARKINTDEMSGASPIHEYEIVPRRFAINNNQNGYFGTQKGSESSQFVDNPMKKEFEDQQLDTSGPFEIQSGPRSEVYQNDSPVATSCSNDIMRDKVQGQKQNPFSSQPLANAKGSFEIQSRPNKEISWNSPPGSNGGSYDIIWGDKEPQVQNNPNSKTLTSSSFGMQSDPSSETLHFSQAMNSNDNNKMNINNAQPQSPNIYNGQPFSGTGVSFKMQSGQRKEISYLSPVMSRGSDATRNAGIRPQVQNNLNNQPQTGTTNLYGMQSRPKKEIVQFFSPTVINENLRAPAQNYPAFNRMKPGVLEQRHEKGHIYMNSGDGSRIQNIKNPTNGMSELESPQHLVNRKVKIPPNEAKSVSGAQPQEFRGESKGSGTRFGSLVQFPTQYQTSYTSDVNDGEDRENNNIAWNGSDKRYGRGRKYKVVIMNSRGFPPHLMHKKGKFRNAKIVPDSENSSSVTQFQSLPKQEMQQEEFEITPSTQVTSTRSSAKILPPSSQFSTIQPSSASPKLQTSLQYSHSVPSSQHEPSEQAVVSQSYLPPHPQLQSSGSSVSSAHHVSHGPPLPFAGELQSASSSPASLSMPPRSAYDAHIRNKILKSEAANVRDPNAHTLFQQGRGQILKVIPVEVEM